MTPLGYVRGLMSAAMEELKKQGYQKIYLWVLEENSSARRFYERMGFVPGGRTQTGSFAGKEVRELQYILE